MCRNRIWRVLRAISVCSGAWLVMIRCNLSEFPINAIRIATIIISIFLNRNWIDRIKYFTCKTGYVRNRLDRVSSMWTLRVLNDICENNAPTFRPSMFDMVHYISFDLIDDRQWAALRLLYCSSVDSIFFLDASLDNCNRNRQLLLYENPRAKSNPMPRRKR